MIKRNTLILLGVFALLLVVMIVLQRLPEEEPAETLEDIPTQAVLPALFAFEPADVAGVRIENAEGQVIHFAREGEGWITIEPPAVPEEVDAIRLESLVSQLTFLRLVTETVLEVDLAALGLETPGYTLLITLVSGEEHELLVGDASIAGTGYYVSVDGAPPQLVSKSILDTFITLFDNPPLLPTPIPTLDESGTITDTATLEPEG
ncbi:MAG TPA: hypothetical protein VMN57_16815 [Anaerolineales bacterium]|nr:hypothetical protein [Anaerolineales bacterium]